VVEKGIAHTAHHRAEQTTLLRLRGRQVWSVYGPSVDTGGLPANGARTIYPYPNINALIAGESGGEGKTVLPGPGRLPSSGRPPAAGTPTRRPSKTEPDRSRSAARPATMSAKGDVLVAEIRQTLEALTSFGEDSSSERSTEGDPGNVPLDVRPRSLVKL